MKKLNLSYLFTGLALVILLVGFVATREQQVLADKLIRLHVVANSDSEVDQQVKLSVRDGVLAAAEPLTMGQSPMEDLAEHLGDLEQVANEILAENDSVNCATVTLARELFPTRYYDTFTLPAGTYNSLRVAIGAGEGHNWWCVVYPSLCLPASTQELKNAAHQAGLTDREITWITQEETGYQLEFQTLEWLKLAREKIGF